MASLAHTLTTNSQVSLYQREARPWRRRRGLIARSGALIARWAERSRDRALLARLSDRELHDIGLSRCDIDHEISKPFWRA